MTEQELRRRVCDQARYWLGRKESDGSHRVIIDVFNSIPIPGGYRMTYDDPWCAAYVSAVGYAVGLSDIIYPDCGCESMIRQYREHGRWMEDDAYRPEPGDIIFYDWDDKGAGDNTGFSDHVGLVLSTTGNTVSVIEGNTSDAVRIRTRTVDQMYIRGYGLPDYASRADDAGEGLAPPADEPVVVPTPDESGPNTGDYALPLHMLRRGDKGDEVKAAQILLIGWGCSCGPDGADGDFGPATEGAVMEFQWRNGLTVDGVIGPMTMAKLHGF